MAPETDPPSPAAGRSSPADAAALLADLSRATGGLAHELRNPLSTLRVNLQLLAEDWRTIAAERTTGAADVAEIGRRSVTRVDALLREIDRLDATLEGFLRLAGRRELILADCDLRDLVRDELDLLAPELDAAGIKLRASLPPQSLRARVDDNLVKQALLNLLINARQAMPAGGELIVRSTRDGDRARIEVIDTGDGIPRESLDRVFEPYYSTRRNGTGLGLPTARRIIADHGGSLRVESEPGQGSRFIVELPLVADARNT